MHFFATSVEGSLYDIGILLQGSFFLFFLEEGLYHIFHREATQERWQMIFGPSAERINRLLGGKTQLLCQHIP